ncbi:MULTISPECIES: glycoside hydrolase family 97 catalytic domain-containing protein [unclassified Microbulbifer]|uniref:glycoside hydrolase family 97 protein n=1 Tax=unclassified Microbulbifer TaxID=2619833 RepID=UPI0027E45F89|nr:MULTISPECIES: glycoside hydrolase family 97 catalytic domain-containing protein [unclassified Microbulbifer]
MKRSLSTTLFLALCTPALAADWSLQSPDSSREIQVRQNKAEALEYRMLLHSGKDTTELLGWSPLGPVIHSYNFRDIPLDPIVSDFSHTVKFHRQRERRGEDNYTLVTGKRRENHAEYRELALEFTDTETKLAMTLELRAYDDGLAFRYVLPEKSDSYYRMVEEKTAFNVGEGSSFWGQPYDFNTIYHPSYETPWQQVTSGTAVLEDEGVGWGFPSLVQKGDAWLVIHEAGLDEHFHGSHLQPKAEDGIYRIAPPSKESALGFGSNIAASTLPWQMPWRFVIAGENLAEIVESNLVFHLSPASRVEDTSWIEPGVSSWSWLTDHESPRNMQTLKKFIDLAAEMGWEYSLIDTNWNTIADDAMEQLVAYGKQKKVRLIFWYNSGGRHNFIGELPRNRMDERSIRRAEFAKLQKLGVAGIKVDFFQSDKQDIVRLYQEILEDAADFQLLANFHGSTIPRGWQRTWPHLMSMEAVRGAEFYTFSADTDYDENAPRYNTILPFARNVIGSMDYTPSIFSQPPAGRHTTNAHEAALAVVFESGIQHISDSVESIRALPTDYRKYLQQLPTAWDETRLLAGFPGEHAVLARRSGKRWFIAGINGEAKEKTLQLNISQLDGLGKRALHLYDDSEHPFAAGQVQLKSSEMLQVSMEANGGFVMMVD